MKKIIMLVFLFLASTSYANQKAITDLGEEVILNSDGTWQYSSPSQSLPEPIPTNPKSFTKSAQATFLVKSKINNSAYWFNPERWTFQKGVDGDSIEYDFDLKAGDLYAMTIAWEIEIPLESLIEIAVENAVVAAPDARVVQKEYRMVNGHKVIFMQTNGTIQGVKFSYLGYYYSDSSGATQVLAYTATNLISKYQTQIDEFLNGFISR